MDQQSSDIRNQCSVASHQIQVNLSDNLRKYRQLDTAVKQGQKETIKLLLQRDTPVNRHPTFHELRTPLHSAVFLGDLEIVRRLLSKGASVNAKYFGDTPLTLAAKFKKYEITDLLLSAKDLKNCCNSEDLSHFHIACMRNQVDIAEKLLMSKHDVNASVNSLSYHWPGFTPLHFAVEFQCVEAVEFLLRCGADITIKDFRTFTPLHLANMYRNEEIIDMILKAHEKVVSNPKNEKGLTHFHIACTRNNTSIVEHFIKLGEDPDDVVFPNSKGIAWHGKNAIDMAIYYECIDVVKLLLKSRQTLHGCRGHELDHINYAYCTGNMEIVHLLATHDEMRRSIPHVENLAHSYLIGLDKRLLGWTLDLSKKVLSQMAGGLNSSVILAGCTPLHMAIEHGSKKVAEFLLRQNVDFTIQNMQGKSALHLAFERNMESLVKLMLQNHKGFQENPIDNDGISHLHIACIKNDADIVDYLLKLEPDAVKNPVKSDATVWAGFTPLHFAAKFGSLNAAEVLLQRGADYSAVNASNLSAFDVALAEADETPMVGYFEIMKAILNLHSQYKNEFFNDRGFTLLHLANISKQLSDSKIKAMRRIFKAHPNDINKAVHKINCRWDGYTPLHFAAKRLEGDGSHARYLISKGADIFKQTSGGDTPLHLSMHALSNAFSQLLQDEIDPSDHRLLTLNHIGTTGFSIFHKACAAGDLKLMKYFLDHGIDAHHPTLAPHFGYGDGDKPLHLAVLNDADSSVGAVKLLLDHGADPNTVDYQNNTPLHKMFNNGRPEIIEILVNHGADVDALNAIFETPLISVCHESNLYAEKLNRLVASFFENGADINLEDQQNHTVLSLDDWYEYGEMDLSACSMIIDTFLAHVTKLKVADFHVNETNEWNYSSLQKDFAKFLHFKKNVFTRRCENEVERMKQIHIDQCSTLYDILHHSPNKLAAISQNSNFQKIVRSNDLSQKFPMYGYLLKLKLKQGQVRWPLMNESRKALNSLARVALPRSCVDDILHHLKDQDLKNLIKA